MPHPLAAMFESLAERQEEKEKPLPSLEGQKEVLEDFLNRLVPAAKELTVGDWVRLNSHGKAKYNFPREGQLGLVVSVFDKPIAEEYGVAHGEVAVVHHNVLQCHILDFRYLEKTDVA